MVNRTTKLVATVMISGIFLLPSIAAAERLKEQPNAFTMIGDLFIARPLGLAFLAAGTGAFVLSLPITLLGGNARDGASELVFKPALEVFVRCLGCTHLGRKEKVIARRNRGIILGHAKRILGRIGEKMRKRGEDVDRTPQGRPW
jgi:hypothetical protein